MLYESINEGVKFRLMLIGVITASFILRFFYAGSFALLQEEAYYWNYAQHLDIGYFDHPPMVAVIIKIATVLFGNSEFAIRIGALLCWCVATLFVYLTAREINNRDTALQAAAIMSVLPAFFIFGFIMTPDAPQIACWAGVLYFSHRALVFQHERSWIGIGVFLGLGLFSKYTMLLLGLAILVFLLIDKPSRRWLLKPQPYCAAAIALLLFSPVIIWNLEHGWASFLFQTHDRLSASSEFSTHELLASIVILLSPLGFFALVFFVVCRKTLITPDPIVQHHYKFASTAMVVPLVIFLVFSLTKEVKFNWTSPLWLAALPFVAITLSQSAGNMKKATHDRFLRGWKITIVSLLLAYGWGLQYYSIGIPGIPYSGEGPLLGWAKYAVQIDTIVDSIEQETGKRPYVLGMDLYKSASGLAFYRTLQFEKDHVSGARPPILETAGRSLFGREAVMYDYWFSPSDFKDKPLVIVSPNREELERGRLVGIVESVGEIFSMAGSKNGKKIKPLFYRLINVTGYDKRKSISYNGTSNERYKGSQDFASH